MRLRFLWQLTAQVFGLSRASTKYKGNFPDRETYTGLVEYSLPFKGKWVVINGGYDEETSHSWDIYPQRYALDFAILDDEAYSYAEDEKDLTGYFSYGKEVLAPADGIVVETYDGFKDCRIIGNGEIDNQTSDLGGNRIVIKHAEHEFSTLCHLMPGSIRVKARQAVKRGDIIARCGNSGHTSEPHIHFQLQNTAKFYSSLGLPIRFKNINATPAPNYELFDRRPIPIQEYDGSGYIVRGLVVENN